MTESDLDSLYGELCRSLSEVGEARAPLLLARFALLAIGAIDDPDRVRALLTNARECEAARTPEDSRDLESSLHRE